MFRIEFSQSFGFEARTTQRIFLFETKLFFDITMAFVCEVCGKKFGQLKNLNRHLKGIHEGVEQHCTICTYTSNRQDNLDRHYETNHRVFVGEAFECEICHKIFAAKKSLNQHKRNHPAEKEEKMEVEEEKKGRASDPLKIKRFEPERSEVDLPAFFDRNEANIVQYLVNLVESSPVKAYLAVNIRFIRETDADGDTEIEHTFYTENAEIVNPFDLEEIVAGLFAHILRQVGEFTKEGSG